MTNREKNRDILNIFIVLGSAVISAGLLSLIFLYYYNPSGRYLAGNVLLDPSIIEQINNQDQNLHKGKQARFSFDRFEFSYFDTQKNQIQKISFSFEDYQTLYRHISSERSLQEVPRDVQSLFFQTHPAMLTINMRTNEGVGKGVATLFQVVQFTPEDYFRIQLNEKKDGEWVYFYHQGSYQEVIGFFPSRR